MGRMEQQATEESLENSRSGSLEKLICKIVTEQADKSNAQPNDGLLKAAKAVIGGGESAN